MVLIFKAAAYAYDFKFLRKTSRSNLHITSSFTTNGKYAKVATRTEVPNPLCPAQGCLVVNERITDNHQHCTLCLISSFVFMIFSDRMDTSCAQWYSNMPNTHIQQLYSLRVSNRKDLKGTDITSVTPQMLPYRAMASASGRHRQAGLLLLL